MTAFVRNVFASLAAGNQPAAKFDENFSDVHDAIQNGSLVLVGTISGTNTITGTTAVGPPTALTQGQYVFFVPAATSTGAVTFARDGLAPKSVLLNGAALTGGEFQINVPTLLFYDGAAYQIVGPLLAGTIPGPLRITGNLTVGGSLAGGSGSFLTNQFFATF